MRTHHLASYANSSWPCQYQWRLSFLWACSRFPQLLGLCNAPSWSLCYGPLGLNITSKSRSFSSQLPGYCNSNCFINIVGFFFFQERLDKRETVIQCPYFTCTLTAYTFGVVWYFKAILITFWQVGVNAVWMSSLQAHFPFPFPSPSPFSFFLFSQILAQMSLFAG